MKRLITLMLLAVLGLASTQSFAQDIDRDIKRDAKKISRQLEKEGWEVFGSLYSLEDLLAQHYQTIRNGEGRVTEITGEVSNFRSKNLGAQTALANAANKYAAMTSTEVYGRTLNDMSFDANNPGEEYDRFAAAYESSVSKSIEGELELSFSIIRLVDKKKGLYEMQAYFTIDEHRAESSKLRAMEDWQKQNK